MTPFARALAVLLTVPLVALCAWMLRGVSVPVLIGALLAVVLAPLSSRLARKLGRRAAWAPGLVTVATLIVILGPTVVVGVLTFQQLRGLKASGLATSILEATGSAIHLLQRSFGWLSRLGIDMSFASLHGGFEQWVQSLLSALGDFAGGALSSAPDLVVAAFLVVLAFFYWLRDGPAFLAWLQRVLPFPHDDTLRLFGAVHDAARGIMIGQLLTGAAQAAVTLVFLFALGVPGAFLWGILAFVLSFIPLFGTTPVTLGATLYLFSQGRVVAGIVMAVGAVIIGLVDNVIRPLVASNEGKAHPLFTLVAIFGGLATMGASGIFLGPVVATLALWSIDFYSRERARADAS